MQEKDTEIAGALQEVDVANLIKFIRQEEDNEHVAQLCADLSSEFSRIARFLGKVGFSLSDEWKSADHLVLSVKEYKTRLLALHIRATGDHDNQGVDVSQTLLGKRRETARVSFSLPAQFDEAKTHVLSQVFEVFPKERLLLPLTASERVPLFEDAPDDLPPTWDEGVIKQRALDKAATDGLAQILVTPCSQYHVRPRSFSR